MRSTSIHFDPVLAYATSLYINNELLKSNININKKDFKLKTDYELNNKLFNRNIKSAHVANYVDLARLPSYSKHSISNVEGNKFSTPIKASYVFKDVNLAKLPPQPYPKRSISNIDGGKSASSKKNLNIKVTTTSKITTTTTTTTNRITASTFSSIKPGIFIPLNKENEDDRKKETNKEKSITNEKRYAKFGRDITENIVEKIENAKSNDENKEKNVRILKSYII